MKKTLSFILAAVMLLGCVFALASCSGASSYGKLESAFVKDGYEVSKDFDTLTENAKEELEKEELEIELHLLTKKDGINSSSVMIIEFKSTDEFKDALKESDALKGLISDIAKNEDVKDAYNKLVEDGYAKGNCIVIPLLTLDYKGVTDIVKGA